MRRPQRLIATALLVAFAGALGGCSSGFGGGFDPTDMLDWLDTKKKLPGERKPVFPQGVPGMDQGVPKELYKNNVERQQREIEQQNAAVANAPPPQGQPQAQQPLEPPPGSKASLKKLKGQPQQAAAPAANQQAAEPADGEAAAAEAGPASDAAPPAPKPKKIVRKRITAPPPDQAAPAQSAQQAPPSGGFPAPLPGGTFTR
jgi:hypothetical protein